MSIHLDDQISRRAEEYARRTRQTLPQVVEEALRKLLDREPAGRDQPGPRGGRAELIMVGNPDRRMTDQEYQAVVEQLDRDAIANLRSRP